MLRWLVCLAILTFGAFSVACDSATLSITFENRSREVVLVGAQQYDTEEEPRSSIIGSSGRPSRPRVQRAPQIDSPRLDEVAPGEIFTIDYLSENYDIYVVTIWSEDMGSILFEDYTKDELDTFAHRFIIDENGEAAPAPSLATN